MNEHKNIITIEDEIKEFSDKPVKSSALYKKVKELESNAVPDASEASVGDVLTKGEGGIGWEAPSAGLPDIQSADAGKVLTVKSGGTDVEWKEVPEELPSITGNTGKFLGVNDGGTAVEWKNVPNELPAIGDSDAGKVLQVNSGHTGVEWGSIPNELPSIAAGDAGKVLKVNSGETGTEWGSASGGAIYLHRIRFIVDRNLYTVTNDIPITVTIINSSSTALTLTTLLDELIRFGYDNTTGRIFAYPATGYAILLNSSTTYSWQSPVGIVAHKEMGSWSLGLVMDELRYDSSTNAMEQRGGVVFTTWNNFTDTVVQV